MYEVMRCLMCGKLRLFTLESLARQGYECDRCGGNRFIGPKKYRLHERLKLAWWCVRENAREGNMGGWRDYIRAFQLGLRPVLPEGK